MYSWLGRQSEPLKPLYEYPLALPSVKLTRRVFLFAPQALTQRATSGTNRTLPRKCVPRYPVVKGRGSICYRKSPPLTALDYWIFLVYPVYADGTKTYSFRPVRFASISQKPLSLAFQIP